MTGCDAFKKSKEKYIEKIVNGKVPNNAVIQFILNVYNFNSIFINVRPVQFHSLLSFFNRHRLFSLSTDPWWLQIFKSSNKNKTNIMKRKEKPQAHSLWRATNRFICNFPFKRLT